MKKILKRKALVLDHDDTVVASTVTVHYPAFVKAIKTLRPVIEPISLHDFQTINLNPGLMDYYKIDLSMSPEEIDQEYRIWQDYIQDIVPEPYPHLHEILLEFVHEGGKIFVSSLNFKNIILRDYELHFPDVEITDIFCRDQHEDLIKPNPQQLHHIMDVHGLKASEILVVDDLHYGLEMAQQAQVDFAYAQYSQVSLDNHRYFNEQAQIILTKPSALADVLYQ